MGVAIQVPFNTMLADLDGALRSLLRDELESHGFNGVEVEFDAPTREWAGGRSTPTLNLFLHDLRQAAETPGDGWREQRSNGSARLVRPPLRVECTYAVTAWTRAVEDEHRLLSQAMAVLLAYEELPDDDRLGERLRALGSSVTARLGNPRHDATPEFWTALGAEYKLSFDYVVTLPLDPGIVFERGPQVRTQTLSVERMGGGATTELHRAAGVVRDAGGEPVQGAWLLLPDLGAWAQSDAQGRYAFSGVPAGRHLCRCRTESGAAAEGELAVPGRGLDLVVAAR